MIATQRPPLAAVLAEVLHPKLILQWLERLPETQRFYGSSRKSTASASVLGLYLKAISGDSFYIAVRYLIEEPLVWFAYNATSDTVATEGEWIPGPLWTAQLQQLTVGHIQHENPLTVTDVATWLREHAL